MAKRVTKGFADKTAKALRDARKHCPTCGEPIEFVKYIGTGTDPEKNSMKFKERILQICSCNRNEYFK